MTLQRPQLNRRLITPRRWTPPAAPPDTGRTARTAALRTRRRLATGGHGPEDVIFDTQGRVLTGLADGSVVRIDPATGERTVLGNTGGRPLGLEPTPDGGVLICDHDRGLLRMAPDGAVEVLVDTLAGTPLTFASNVVLAADGTIFFTVSTRRWDLDHYLGDIFEHSCTGALVRRDPDGTVTVLRDDLKFGNGLALAPDGSCLFVTETAGYRINRLWLTGDKAGTEEPFVHNLPGMPDNISLGSDHRVWVSIAAPRSPLLDALLPLPGFVRLLLWNLPEAVRPDATPISWVMAFDLDGTVAYDLRSQDSSYGFVTSVTEYRGTVVAGSVHADDLIVLDLPAS